MFKSIVAIVIIVAACAQSTSRDDGTNFLYMQGWNISLKKTMIEGTTCVVVVTDKGVALSCDWESDKCLKR